MSFKLWFVPLLFLALGLVSLSLYYPALAADKVVTDCTNDTQFNTAVSSAGAITFNCGTSTINLTTTKYIIDDISIDGGNQITLSGQNARLLFNVDTGRTLTLTNIILTDGYNPTGDGGAIQNWGTVILDHVTVRNSAVPTTNSGGAIASIRGTLIINNSILEGNRGASGGALFPRFWQSRTYVTNSTIRNNQTTSTTDGWGGAILAWDGAAVTITNSSLYGNTAGFAGGAVYNQGSSSLTLQGSQVYSNTAPRGGAIYHEAVASAVTITNSSIYSNTAATGAGIYYLYGGKAGLIIAGSSIYKNVANGSLGGGIYLGSTHFLTVTNSQFYENRGTDGGAIYAYSSKVTIDGSTIRDNTTDRSQAGVGGTNSTVIISNTTISGNSTARVDQWSGGGIGMVGGSNLQLSNVTISGNTAYLGGGIDLDQAVTANLTNVTLADNISLASGIGQFHNNNSSLVTFANVLLHHTGSTPNCTGINPTGSLNSLSDDSTCNFEPGGTNVNVMLGPLANNGGPTLTHAPLTGSPAIDNGSDAKCPAADQRGIGRPIDGNGDGIAHCDVGAVEVSFQGIPVFLPLIRR